MKTTCILLASVLIAPLAWAQGVLPDGTTPFGTRQPQPSNPAVSQNVNAGTAGNYSSSTSEGMVDRLFDVNSDSVDMENGSVQWKGRTFNLGNSRVMRARLDRYFSSPPPNGDAKRYEEVINRIEQLLSPQNITRSNYEASFQEAWNLLFEAGKYDGDAENCLTIASLVLKTTQMRDEMKGLQMTKNQLEAVRKLEEEQMASRARGVELRTDVAAEKARGGKNPKPVVVPQQGRTDLGLKQKDSARAEAEILRTDSNMTAMGIKAKLEFQSQIVAFLFQRRFHHAIIASSFYRQVFKGSSQELTVGSKQVKEMFPVSDFVPSIDSVDMLAREAIKDVDVGMMAVNQLYDMGDRYSAFERIQETFFLGEYDPKVMFFDPEKKRVMQEVWRNLRDLQRMGDERDLSGVEELVNKVKAVAPDFPAAQIVSRVNNAMQSSNLAVLSAKQAALMGDMKKAEDQLTVATKIWPTNPSVRDFMTEVVNRSDLLSQKVPEFDRLYQGGKFRDIYNRKEEFGIALMQDKDRSAKLMTVVNQVGEIENRIMQARTLSRQGNNYLAWDVLQMATAVGSDDPELGKIYIELAPSVSNYARLLDSGAKNEKEGNYAASLSDYLAAQDLNQTSETCQQHVSRLSALMMNEVMLVR
ncbi:MAG: hypothetical protein LBV12_13175 [Puniceicoccales bacterium]|jgi:hypothetical protein|nr:hypothetical protein [Puniceicoccales bacterium]